MLNFFRSIQGYRRFLKLPLKEKELVFYAETAACFVHFEDVIDQLIQQGNRLCYVTSDCDDPILKSSPGAINPFYVGAGMARMLFFETLKAKLLVMTMPDLETLEIKRSKGYPVHYCHLFHSPVSSHMTYRNAAFDYFDSVLCVGPHHMEEIRATERLHGTKEKQLFQHGYARIDHLYRLKKEDGSSDRTQSVKKILLAPSWGPNGIIETMGEELVGVLLGSGYEVMLRPHPMTKRKSPQVLKRLQERFGDNPAFIYDADVAMTDSLLESDLMISDYSGVALEYAFGLEKPVVYLDVPRKVRNERYQEIPCMPLEVSIRSKIGAIVAPDALDALPQKIEELLSSDYLSRIRQERSNYIFNLGSNGKAGAQAVQELLSHLD